MFAEKKSLALLTSVILLAACGGGGDGGSSTTAATPAATTGTTPPAGTGTGTGTPATGSGTGTTTNTGTPATGTGTAPPTTDPSAPSTGTGTPGSTPTTPTTPATGTGTGTPATTPGTPTGPTGGTTAPADQQLRGHLSLVANQLVYLQTDRSIYNAVTLNQFESTLGMYDFASGSKGGDSATQVPPVAPAPAAPVAAFGFRIDKFVQRATLDQAIGNQTVVGRVALSLVEREGSAGIGASEAAESLRLVIDRVELSTNANGELVSARVQEGAQMHVYGQNAARVEVRESIPVPARAVRLLPMSAVLDNYGDNSSVVLLLDLESAFSQAGQRLAALENIAGHFTINVTVSAAQLVRPAEGTAGSPSALPRRELVGQSITVNSQPAVMGAGVSGNAWIRMYPPAQ